MSNDGGQDRITRQVLEHVGQQMRATMRHYRKVDFTIETSLTDQLTVESLQQRTACLRICMLESLSRVADGPNDDYLALIEAHRALENYARRIFPDVKFSVLESGLEDGPEPDIELDHIVGIVNQLVDSLNAITA